MFGLRKPKKTYQCSICNHEGKTLTSLKNHFKKKHSFENECLFCEESVNNLNTHALKRHISHIFRCGICKEDFTTTDSIKMHYFFLFFFFYRRHYRGSAGEGFRYIGPACHCPRRRDQDQLRSCYAPSYPQGARHQVTGPRGAALRAVIQ